MLGLFRWSLRRVKMDQRKLTENQSTLVDMAKVGACTSGCRFYPRVVLLTLTLFSTKSFPVSWLVDLGMDLNEICHNTNYLQYFQFFFFKNAYKKKTDPQKTTFLLHLADKIFSKKFKVTFVFIFGNYTEGRLKSWRHEFLFWSSKHVLHIYCKTSYFTILSPFLPQRRRKRKCSAIHWIQILQTLAGSFHSFF